MAKIIKLNSKKETNIGDYTYYNIGFNISCSDGYRSGLNHKFEGSENQVKLLLIIIKRLNIVTLSDITKTSFIFSSTFTGPQQFVFRICRYVRFKGLLEFIVELNQKYKITIHTAILIGVLKKRYDNQLTYYDTNRDIINVTLNTNRVCWSFPTLKAFKKNINKDNVQYYNIYLYDGHESINEKLGNRTRTNKMRDETFKIFKKLLDDNQYKKVAYLLSKRLY